MAPAGVSHSADTNGDWKISYAVLPCIYSSFVRRSVIERVRAKTGGRYFAAGSPDVYTGIANAYVTPKAAYLRRALSLSGNSGASTGSAHFFRSKGGARVAEYWRDEGITRGEALHPTLIDACNLEVGLADTMIRAKELLFPDDDRYQVRMQHVLGAMLGAINRDPASYDDNLGDIRAFALKHGFDPTRLPIVPSAAATRRAARANRRQRPRRAGDRVQLPAGRDLRRVRGLAHRPGDAAARRLHDMISVERTP